MERDKYDSVIVLAATSSATYIMGAVLGHLSLLPLIPLVILCAFRPWARAKKPPSLPELRPQDGMVQLNSDVVSEPVFISDCKVVILDGRSHQPKHYDIGAEGLAHFCQKGWQVNFSSRKLKGLEFKDSRRTKVTGDYWMRATDILAEGHLILKEPDKPIRSLVSLDNLLRSVLPEPFPSGWRGWFK